MQSLASFPSLFPSKSDDHIAQIPVSVSPTTSLSVLFGKGRWGTLLRKDSRWLGEASALNRL